MYNLIWSRETLTGQKLGTFCEYYAKMTLASYGLSIYTSEVDDHGIDFVSESKDGRFLKFQVKSIRTDRSGYVFMKERHFPIDDNGLYLFLILLEDNEHPKTFIIPASAWRSRQGKVFVYREKYKEPEYGINVSRRNMPEIEKFRLENMIDVLLK